MRKHYESLNYLDGDPASALFRINRTQHSPHAVIETMGRCNNFSYALTRLQVMNLRDILNEVLEDWK